MVRFPGCPECGTTSDAHAITCKWLDRDTPAKLAARVERRRYLPPVMTRAALLKTPGARHDPPLPGSNVRDVFEGPRVDALAFVFGQLAELGLGKTDQERPEWRPNPSR